jgi:hypothetical protein
MTQIETAPRTVNYIETQQQTGRFDRIAAALSSQVFMTLEMLTEQNKPEPKFDEDDGNTIVRSNN